MKKVFILALLLLTWKGIAQNSGEVYYVATNGNDLNPGTIEQPWASWQRAVDVAMPGDTVYIRGGVYLPTSYVGSSAAAMLIRPRLNIGRSGTPGNPICYFAYPGEQPILDGSLLYPDDNYNIGINIEYAEYISFKGLTVRNFYQYRYPVQVHGIAAVVCANLNFENCTVHDVSGRGFYFASGAWELKYGETPVFDGDTTRFINCDAYNICDSIDNTTNDPARIMPGNAGDGFITINYDHNILIFEGCRAWNYSDDGFNPSSSGRVFFDNCWVFNSMDTLNIGGVNYRMEGNGFKIGARGAEYAPYPYPVQTIVRNCIAANCYRNGFYTNVEADYQNHAQFYNNTSYKNGYGFAEPFRINDPVMFTVYKNNLVYDSRLFSAVGEPYNCALGNEPYTESHNTWDYDPSGYPGFVMTDTVTVTDDDFVSLDVNQLARPRKADGSLPYITFGQLAPGSDLIDAGTDVGLPYKGSAPDIGAVEYNDGITNTPPSIQLTSPKAGSSFSVGETIKLTVETSDVDGTVEKVSYYYGNSQKIGESTAAPWSYDWTNTPEGEYQIWAIATDNQNAQANSKKINITIEEDNQVIYFKVLSTSPNPTVDIITTEFTCPRATKVGINVVDIFNRNALSDHIETNVGRNKLVLNLSTLKTGNYTIILNMEDQEIRVPITRQEIL